MSVQIPRKERWEDLRDLCRADGGKYSVSTLKDASRFCLHWARQHYENFPVASLLLSPQTRAHVAHLYAFARLADDIADHPTASPTEKLQLLEMLEQNLLEPLRAESLPGNPVLAAFCSTLRTTGLPLSLPKRLLVAFRYDACFRPFATWQDVEWYCHHSANPIGEALLFLHQSCTPQALCASNALCTALQVLNFWQDLSVDLPRGRCYLPQQLLERHGLPEPAALWQNSAKLQLCLAEVAAFVQQRLERAKTLWRAASHPRLRWQIALTLAAADTLYERLVDLGDRVLSYRPQLSGIDGIVLLIRSWRYRSR
ncbi:MAG: squalene/phytoene synthase family protein [Chlorobiota bacterium]